MICCKLAELRKDSARVEPQGLGETYRRTMVAMVERTIGSVISDNPAEDRITEDGGDDIRF